MEQTRLPGEPPPASQQHLEKHASRPGTKKRTGASKYDLVKVAQAEGFGMGSWTWGPQDLPSGLLPCRRSRSGWESS